MAYPDPRGPLYLGLYSRQHNCCTSPLCNCVVLSRAIFSLDCVHPTLFILFGKKIPSCFRQSDFHSSVIQYISFVSCETRVIVVVAVYH